MAQGRELYSKLFKLAFKQTWLAEYQQEVDSLFDECDTDEQVELVSDLLYRFTYLGVDEEEAAISQIAESVIGLGFPASTIQIVSMSADDDADSGQAVLYALKSQFARKRFDDVKLVNTFGKAQRYVLDRPNVVLVDEFVGTGRTLKGRLAALIRDFQNNKGVTDAKFFVYAYAGMRQALESVQAEGLCDVVKFLWVLDRGISDARTDAAPALVAMNALEQKLLPNCHGIDMPKLGDGGCEALYGRRGGNCPNSVFPVFWWPMNSGRAQRAPLLVRKMP